MPATRALAIFIIPFLIVAAAILYFWPTETKRLFAWPIQPPLTAMILAAAYAGGIYFFVNVAVARRWHTVKAGFLPVTYFAAAMGIATVLHWNRFTHGHVAFWAWSTLYFVTPFLVFLVWLRNRPADSGTLDPTEVLLSPLARGLLGVLGAATLFASLLLFVVPGLMIAVWPWTLTPLTSRVMGAMFGLPGILFLELAADRRWSTARVMLQAQAFSLALILIAFFRAWDTLDRTQPAFWVVFGTFLGVLVAIVVVYAIMERRCGR